MDFLIGTITGFSFALLPLLLVTVLLSFHARWAWGRTRDKVIAGMKIDAVANKVERAVWHRRVLKRHAIAAATVLVVSILLSLLNLGFGQDTAIGMIGFFTFLWIYCLLVPHILGLYLYHVRWNPQTLARKQKLDAQESHYAGNYDLDPQKQYGVNEEGELIELGMLAEETTEAQQRTH